MSASPSFSLIPWERDFLQGLLDIALHDTDGDIGKAAFIFPHSRPKRYLTLLLRRDARVRRPLLMPRMYTVSELFSQLSARALARPARTIGALDRVGLLLDCARRTADGEGSPFLLDAERFFPWGLRLAALFEECFSQRLEPGNFLYPEDEVSPFAALLLRRLGGIFKAYRKALDEREWTTPGHEAAVLTDFIVRQGRLPEPDPFSGASARPLYVAGFHLLTGAEETLFRLLWQESGARIVIHADSALVTDPESAHWSCKNFSGWAARWRARLLLAAQPVPERKPRIRYYAGYDLHSQLQVLARELADLSAPLAAAEPPGGGENGITPDMSWQEWEVMEEEAAFAESERRGPEADSRADTAVLLPSAASLLPVLHHLPHTDINVSMGYPLARSPLFRLLDTLAGLQEGRRQGAYYWRDLVQFVRHPYVRMLRSPEARGDEARPSLRRGLRHLETALRERGQAYVFPSALLDDIRRSSSADAGKAAGRGGFDAEAEPGGGLLRRLLAVCLDAFADLKNTAELASALNGLCELLLTCAPELWKRFPIDAECLVRLRRSLIPELLRSELADELFAPESLFAFLRRLLEAERVPFEAEPLVGLQVMGMLESRLLSFRRVLVVDAVEEYLPGLAFGDPLLPEALRPDIGLPSPHAREQAAAYTFFRLLAGAEDVLLLWREGGDSPGVGDQKNSRSRFVEELLWREEKERGAPLAADVEASPLRTLSARILPLGKKRRSIRVSPPLAELFRMLRARPLSASLLDGYLRCPAHFCRERLLQLAPAAEVVEGDDPVAVGTLLHAILQEAYEPYLNRPLPGGEELAALLGANVEERFFASPEYAALQRSLAADSSALLAEAVQWRLREYLLRQPPLTVLDLETEMRAVFTRGGHSCLLTGKADRIDLRERGDGLGREIIIVDYKTGSVPRVADGLWDDEALWAALDGWNADAPDGESEGARLLDELAEKLQSVQLPLYMFLFAARAEQEGRPGGPPAFHAGLGNALWVTLREHGEEVPLLRGQGPRNRPPLPPSPEYVRRVLTEQVPVLLDFLLRHMFSSPVMRPRPGRHCDWCFYQKSCIHIDGLE